MRILVTGSRDWADAASVFRALDQTAAEASYREITIVHGGARGADGFAHIWAIRNGFTVERHPANWRMSGKAAGFLRNQHMINLGADVCLAFPLGVSRGTRDCMRRAEAAGIPIRNYGAA